MSVPMYRLQSWGLAVSQHEGTIRNLGVGREPTRWIFSKSAYNARGLIVNQHDGTCLNHITSPRSYSRNNSKVMEDRYSVFISRYPQF